MVLYDGSGEGLEFRWCPSLANFLKLYLKPHFKLYNVANSYSKIYMYNGIDSIVNQFSK